MKIKGINEENTILLRATLGRHRKKRLLTPFRVAALIGKSIEEGENKKTLSEKINLSTDMITKFLKLLDIKSPEIKSKIVWASSSADNISMSTAAHLARLKSAQDQGILFKAIKDNKLTKAEANEIVTYFGRSGETLEDCIHEILNSRPKVTENRIIIGKLTSNQLTKNLRNTQFLERNKLLRKVLDENLVALPYNGAKLNIDSFVIYGDKNSLIYLSSLKGGFEEYITKLLLEYWA